MNREEVIRKLEYSKKAYQMLIDEKVDSGILVGKDVNGEWKADTPLDEAYKSMIEALEMAIKALEQEPCDNAVSRQDVLDLAKKGVLISNGSYKSVCKAINEIPPAEQKWIPVSERLPEDKTYVLTTIKVPNRIAHARSGCYMGGFFHNDNGDTWKATDMEVVAWMPLPKPYEPQESER